MLKLYLGDFDVEPWWEDGGYTRGRYALVFQEGIAFIHKEYFSNRYSEPQQGNVLLAATLQPSLKFALQPAKTFRADPLGHLSLGFLRLWWGW